ncbi:Translation initiation factor 2 [Labilithrix luteola]|uniref:Translation initiation factor 2 n=1 Tax=Labilithrix luteola TaxID=1391654 RepID=A0A0K1QD92_9BACT|nr:hypothetical protein [Labilithrix luteola]AKV03400.1 Translation initiation factor 2 [Labilithrix luteola]
MPTEPGLAPSSSDWEVIETKDEPAAAPPAKVAPALPTKGEPTPAAPTVAAVASAAAAQAVQAATNASLSTAMREEVWTIVRAAVTEAMTPVVARQKDLEAQLDTAAKVKPAAAPPPVPVAAAAAAAPVVAAASAPKHVSAPPPAKTASIPVSVSASSPPVVTSYGLVMTAQRRSDEIDLAAIARAPVDYDGFDGNRRKRIITRLLVAVILLGFVGLVTMTILSHG